MKVWNEQASENSEEQTTRWPKHVDLVLPQPQTN
jgi:hypothetical protein